ncbi:MAG: hypothetical protein P8X80_08935 [Desulfobacterales bacterium]|jgi:hypothetical protein
MPVPHQAVAGAIDIVEIPEKIPSSPLTVGKSNLRGIRRILFIFNIFSKYCATRQD